MSRLASAHIGSRRAPAARFSTRPERAHACVPAIAFELKTFKTRLTQVQHQKIRQAISLQRPTRTIIADLKKLFPGVAMTKGRLPIILILRESRKVFTVSSSTSLSSTTRDRSISYVQSPYVHLAVQVDVRKRSISYIHFPYVQVDVRKCSIWDERNQTGTSREYFSSADRFNNGSCSTTG